MRDYHSIIDWIYNQFPVYQRQGSSAYKKDISNVRNFFQKKGNDFNFFKSIHVGGTNGKGSVSHMLASILQEQGFRVGLFTSPHMIDFRERIKISGKEISKDFIVKFVNENKLIFKELDMSFFEITFVLACSYFKENKVELAIVEVGLGGRLDATNIINPILSIITNVSIDHTNILGNNVKKIAKEKAGIIKRNTPLVLGERKLYTIIFEDVCKELDAKIYFAKEHHYLSDLIGDYQKNNINTTVTAINLLISLGFCINESSIINGLNKVKNNTSLLGRWQIVNAYPLLVLDIAHNLSALKVVLNMLRKYKGKKHVILGLSKDKLINSIVSILPKDYNYYLCGSSNPRIVSPKEIKKIFHSHNLSPQCFDFSYEAYDLISPISKKNDIILVTGSTFIVSDMLKYLDKY